MADRIAALTGPDDSVFVWGNSPQLYVLARRPLGSRFTFCNYMTGESPGTPTETGAANAGRSSLPPPGTCCSAICRTAGRCCSSTRPPAVGRL